MGALSVRLMPVGRAEVITPEDQTPILQIVEGPQLLLTLTPRRLDEVSDEEMEAARSLLAAMRMFVEHCEHWTIPAVLQNNGPQGGGAA